MLAALFVTAGFALATRCMTHMFIKNRLDNLAEARSLAEAAAETVLADLLDTPAMSGGVSFSFAGVNGTGRATFDIAQARGWGISPSYNNLQGSAEITAYQRQLPPKAVQIVATGQYNGVTVRIESVSYLPPYQYALASSGNITSTGALTVIGVQDPSIVANGVASVPKNLILPGNVAGNGLGSDSLQFDSSAAAPTLISGDAQTCGTVGLGPDTTVLGALKQNSQPVGLPQIDITSYDPAGFDNTVNLSQAVYGSQLSVSGLARNQGDLTISSGGLNLDAGYLYVNGNLEVYGGLTGTGVIFTTGSLKFTASPIL